MAAPRRAITSLFIAKNLHLDLDFAVNRVHIRAKSLYFLFSARHSE